MQNQGPLFPETTALHTPCALRPLTGLGPFGFRFPCPLVPRSPFPYLPPGRYQGCTAVTLLGKNFVDTKKGACLFGEIWVCYRLCILCRCGLDTRVCAPAAALVWQTHFVAHVGVAASVWQGRRGEDCHGHCNVWAVGCMWICGLYVDVHLVLHVSGYRVCPHARSLIPERRGVKTGSSAWGSPPLLLPHILGACPLHQQYLRQL